MHRQLHRAGARTWLAAGNVERTPSSRPLLRRERGPVSLATAIWLRVILPVAAVRCGAVSSGI